MKKKKKMKMIAFSCACTALLIGMFAMSACDNTYIEEHGITAIEIRTPPDKTSYELGEAFSSEGMSLKVYWDDGFFSYEDEFNCSIAEGELITTADKYFTASFRGWEVTQEIDVSLPEDLFSVLNEGYTTTRMEAEDSVMNRVAGSTFGIGLEQNDAGTITPANRNYPSGDAFIYHLDQAANRGCEFVFEFTASQDSWCVLSFGLGSCGSSASASRFFDDCFAISANGSAITVTTNPLYTYLDWQTDGLGWTKTSYYNWNNRPITIFRVKEGVNTLVVSKPQSSSTGLNWDYIELSVDGTIAWTPNNSDSM